MSNFFDRVCRVIIENKNKITIENCRIKFEITKSSQAKENTGKIEIYNLAPNTRKLITQEDSLVRLAAGYSEYKGLIEVGQGDISKIKTNRSETEVVTEIYLSEGLKKIKNNPVSISYANNVRLTEILDNLAMQTGFSFREVNTNNTTALQSGYADIGSLDSVLDNLALNYNFDWSVQDGVILIRGKAVSALNEIMLLTPESGLILSPESVKKVSRHLAKAKIAKEEKDAISITALLQPQLQVNDVIAVESQDLKGRFKIEKITHTGDTRGNDWYSEMEIASV